LLSDSELVAAAASGSRSAWDRLVDRHAEGVWSTARGSGLDVGAAGGCELTWARLADHLNELGRGGQPWEWLHIATEREAYRVLRGGPAGKGDVV
jgi:hypothetical protein